MIVTGWVYNVPVNDAALVQVEDGREELTDERTRGTLAQTTVLLALDVRQQLTAARILRHQTVQRRRLHHRHHRIIIIIIIIIIIYPHMPIGKVQIYRLLFVLCVFCLYGYGFLRRL